MAPKGKRLKAHLARARCVHQRADVIKRLEPIDNKNRIKPLPNGFHSEFEVQAKLYNELRSLGLDVRGEVKWQDKSTRETCRFDLVIYKNGNATEILEVKARPVRHRNGVERTRQGFRYRGFGVPVTFIYGFKDAEEYISWRRG